MTKDELSKVMEVEAENKYPDTDNHWQQIALNGYKSGFQKCQSILLPEIERLKDNTHPTITRLKIEAIKLNEENQRLRDAYVHISKMGCAYKGNLTGCPSCYICNEFPEFNEMNKRDRNGIENN